MRKVLLGAFVLAVVLALLSGCDIFGILGTYTVKITTYDATSIWTVKYRTSGSSAYKTADLRDSNGDTVYSMAAGSSTQPDTSYFDLPASGTYDFAVYDILGTQIDSINGQTVDTEIATDYDYVLSVASDGTLSFY